MNGVLPTLIRKDAKPDAIIKFFDQLDSTTMRDDMLLGIWLHPRWRYLPITGFVAMAGTTYLAQLRDDRYMLCITRPHTYAPYYTSYFGNAYIRLLRTVELKTMLARKLCRHHRPGRNLEAMLAFKDLLENISSLLGLEASLEDQRSRLVDMMNVTTKLRAIAKKRYRLIKFVDSNGNPAATRALEKEDQLRSEKYAMASMR